MATNVQKIRLGAVDAQILDQGLTTQVDLGATEGGAILTYKPSYHEVEIDQALPLAAVFRTKEELDYETSLVQHQALLYAVSMSQLASLVTTTLAGTLPVLTPAPTVAFTGTAATTSYTYQVVAYNYNGDAVPVAATAFTTGPATITAANFFTITWTNVVGAVGYKVIRSATSGTMPLGLVANVLQGNLSATDTGQAPTAYTASVAAPATPNTDTATFGNVVSTPTRTVDVTWPKNDGTQNHWLFHIWKAYSQEPLIVDAKRDKNAVYKARMRGLGDSTSNFRLLSVTEQY